MVGLMSLRPSRLVEFFLLLNVKAYYMSAIQMQTPLRIGLPNDNHD